MTIETDRFNRIQKHAYKVIRSFGSHTADDLEAAKAIATSAIEVYGDFDEATFAQFKELGIWNDYVAVQAALAAIRMMRVELLALLAPHRATHSFGPCELDDTGGRDDC